MRIRPVGDSTELLLSGYGGVGDIKLWVPEAIHSDSGTCAVYPAGDPWLQRGDVWHQEISVEHSHSSGNCPKIDEHNYECCGIRIPIDQPVSWQTIVWTEPRGVRFTIRLTNQGRATIRQASTMVCVKFLQASWWSEDRVYVHVDGRWRTLAELGRNGGREAALQAYLLDGESCAHPFINQYWGFNHHRLDRPLMVSHCEATGETVTVSAERACFLHRNSSNPCTDLALAFGDVAAGRSAEASGRIRVELITAEGFFDSPENMTP